MKELIREIATKYGLDPELIEAVVKTESSGNPKAYRYEPLFWKRYLQHNPKYKNLDPHKVSASYGLMQIMWPTAKEELGWKGNDPEALYAPEASLDLGCKLLVKNLKWANGDMDAALAAYNGGRTLNNKKPPYRNAAYVAKVHKNLKVIQNEN